MNISSITNQYISEHPSIKDCMRKDLVNFSALSRLICKEKRIKNIEAVIVACRRYQARLKAAEASEDVVRDMVKRARLKVQSKMGVVISERPRDLTPIYDIQRKIRSSRGDCSLVEGAEVLTIITNMEHLGLLEGRLKGSVLKVREDLAQLMLIFDRRIETTSGVMFFIFSLLSGKGINILEEISCWTDVILIMEEKLLATALQALDLS